MTTVELLPVFANAPEPSLMARGARNHWGYSTLGLPRPGAALRRRARAGGRRGPRDGRRAARRRARGGARRGVQPHLRGRRRRAVAVVAGPGRPVVVPARSRRPRHRLHRLRQHLRRRVAAGPRARPVVPAVLGHDDGRGRLPLRPRLDDGPAGRVGVLGLGPAAGRDRRRPGARRRQADRRAVGRDRRGLPGRRVRPGLGGVERALPRRGARLLARRRPGHREIVTRLAGSSDLYWPARTPPRRR